MRQHLGFTKSMLQELSAAKGRKLKSYDVYIRYEEDYTSVVSLRFPGFSLEIINYVDEYKMLNGEDWKCYFKLKRVNNEKDITPNPAYKKPKKIDVQKKLRNVRIVRDCLRLNGNTLNLTVDQMLVLDFDDCSITICRDDFYFPVLSVENGTDFESYYPMSYSKDECYYELEDKTVQIKREIVEI